MTPRSLQSLSHRSYVLDVNGTSVECFPLSADEAFRMATLTSAIRFYVPGCRTIAFDPLAGAVMQDLTELNTLHRHDLDDAEYREDVLLNDLGRHVDQLAVERREHLLGASLVLGASEADRLHLSVFLVVPQRIKSCDLQFSL
jgi:hypothetical protein